MTEKEVIKKFINGEKASSKFVKSVKAEGGEKDLQLLSYGISIAINRPHVKYINSFDNYWLRFFCRNKPNYNKKKGAVERIEKHIKMLFQNASNKVWKDHVNGGMDIYKKSKLV